MFRISDDQKESPTELAFKYAVYQINKAEDILPNNILVYDIQYVPPEDSFRTTKKVRVVDDDMTFTARDSLFTSVGTTRGHGIIRVVLVVVVVDDMHGQGLAF